MSIKSSLSDAQILQDSREQPWLFGLLVDRYEKAFLRKGLYILHSQEDAEDAVQDTFLKIYKYAHKFSERKNASFKSWAYKILTNTCLTNVARRTNERIHVKTMEFIDLDIADRTDTLLDTERVSFVESVLSCLPRNLSRLLSLYFFENKTYEEIAILENLSLSAVRSALHRAKKQFKNIALELSLELQTT